MYFFIPGIAFPLISGLSRTSTLLFIFILASMIPIQGAFLISSSARFLMCIAGVCNTKSTTLHPKVIHLQPSAAPCTFSAIVIVPNALECLSF
jgi:hypothetical protein